MSGGLSEGGSAVEKNAFPYHILGAVMLVAALLRLWILASGSVSFHSDEATVALMARHILQGQPMTFFYGQAYMGSLNAFPVAAGFALLGESVGTLRAVQFLMYLLVVASQTYAAWHLSHQRTVTLAAGLCVAISPLVGVVYSATTIGSYNETLIFGALMLVLGYDLTFTHRLSVWRWLLLGVIVGAAWWANALMIVYAAPIALRLLWAWGTGTQRARVFGLMLLALGAFFVGGLPFWVYNVMNQNAALAFLFPSLFEPVGLVRQMSQPFSLKLVGLLLLGIPTTIGARHPWSEVYFAAWGALPVLLIYIVALFVGLRTASPLRRGARFFVWTVPAFLLLVFLASGFGADPTGRYFLPMLFPLAMFLAMGVYHLQTRLPSRFSGWAWVPLLVVLTYNLAGQLNAAYTQPPGITTQFDLINHIPNDQDAQLIDFLLARGLQHGYTNYWVNMRFAFLSGEQLQYSAALPNKLALTYNPADNRYPPYVLATESAERIAYINLVVLPALDVWLEEQFAAAGVRYTREQVGDYFTVYYDFEPFTPRLSYPPEGFNE